MKENEKKPESRGNCAECNRRQAFVKLGAASLGLTFTGAAVFGYDFLSPNVLYEPSPLTDAGKPDRYPIGRAPIVSYDGRGTAHPAEERERGPDASSLLKHATEQ